MANQALEGLSKALPSYCSYWVKKLLDTARLLHIAGFALILK